MNSSLKVARACVIGISNDLKFTDFDLASARLGQLDVLFKPYDAEQLQDIPVSVRKTACATMLLDRA